jgi:hypothetical protein
MAEPSDEPGAFGRMTDRVSGVFDLLTNLDQRVLASLESLEEVRASMKGLEALQADGDAFVRDLRGRIARADERMHRDFDEIKDAVLNLIGDIDIGSFDDRLTRVESSMRKIERATVDLDRKAEAAFEALPNFLSRKIRSEEPDRTITLDD